METCDCSSCEHKGMLLCDYRRYGETIAKMRMALLITNQVLADLANDGGCAKESKNLAKEAVRMNLKVLTETMESLENSDL